MIKLEKTDVYGWEAAIRGMRNPMNSWDRSDSNFYTFCPDSNEDDCPFVEPIIGEDDLDLMLKLAEGGSVHAKYRRMINVTVDITAPLYWWKEFDTYKVGTVANSCSTMHKIHANELTLDDFSHDHLITEGVKILAGIIEVLNEARDSYLNFDELYGAGELDDELSCKKDVWWQMIQLLPSSYNQKRTIQLNYEVLVGMFRDRKHHKLDEWHTFCDWIRDLPYSEIITGGK